MSRIQKTALLTAAALAVFSFSRLALFLAYRPYFAELSAAQILFGFVAGIRFDLSICLTFLAFPFVMMNLPGAFFRSARWTMVWGWMAYAILLAGALLLAGDTAYFGEVHRHTATELLMIKNDIHYLMDMAFGPYLPQLLLFVLLAAVLGWVWKKIVHQPESSPKRAALNFLILIIFIFLGIRGSVSDKPFGTIDAFSHGNTAMGNLMLNGAFTAYHSALHADSADLHLMPLKEAEAALSLPEGDYPMQKNYAAEPTGYNIVFILMESWGVKYVDSFGHNGYGVTPNFDSLAAGGLKFTNFYAAGQRSITGIQATITGVPPVNGIPALGFGLEVSNISKLGAIASRHGYETIFLQASRRRSFMVDAIAGATGFADYYGMEDYPRLLNYPDYSASIFGWDYETLLFLKTRLDKAKKPFVAYLFTGTTHTPYPPLGKQWDLKATDPSSEDGFLNTLYYSDWSIGEFMKAAEKEPWFAKTIFIFTADHAQVHYGNGSGGFREKFNTPLVIYAPGIFKEPKMVDTVGSQLDILPTIIDLLGFDDPFSAMGDSLFRKSRQRAFCTEGGVVGIITDKGFLTHSLSDRLETGYFAGTAPQGYFDGLEKELLAENQLTFSLLRSNHWAR